MGENWDKIWKLLDERTMNCCERKCRPVNASSAWSIWVFTCKFVSLPKIPKITLAYEIENERKKTKQPTKQPRQQWIERTKWTKANRSTIGTHYLVWEHEHIGCIISVFVLISNYVQNIFISSGPSHTSYLASIELSWASFHWARWRFGGVDKITPTTATATATVNVIVIIRLPSKDEKWIAHYTGRY